MNKRFPRYPDDADYQTNAPSYYEDLARKQKLIKLLAKKIWDYDERLDERLEDLENVLQDYLSQWDERIENLDDEVSHIFVTWLNDGTLEQIINHDVLGNKADTSYVNDLHETVTTELDRMNNELNQIDKLLAIKINVKSFGAIGNGVVDDTQAIKNAIAYAEELKDDNSSERFEKGFAIYFPAGIYKISDTLRVKKSHIGLLGETASSSVIYATSSTFDLVVFDGSEKALYGSSFNNLRIHTPYDTTAGTQLKMINIINSTNTNVELSSGYESLEIDSCGKVMFNGLLITQVNRTPSLKTGYLLKITGKNGGNPGDIHFTDLQITPNFLHTDYAVLIDQSDGIYFNNFHIHGGLKILPMVKQTVSTVASVFFNGGYFDTANRFCISFEGEATNYRNFFFTNCYVRSGLRGINFATDGNVEQVIFIGGKISGHKESGIFCYSDRSQKVIVSNTIFENNNVSNLADHGDYIVYGRQHKISNTIHSLGGNNGYAIHIKNTSAHCSFDNIDTLNSSATKGIVNDGSATSIGTLQGGKQFTQKQGSATIPIGETNVIINHDMNYPVSVSSIVLSPRSQLFSGDEYWASNVTSNTFTVNLLNPPTQPVTLTWQIDLTR